MNNILSDEAVFVVGTSPDGKREFRHINLLSSDVLVPQISDAFEGKSMSDSVAKFMRGLNSTQCILSEANLDNIEMTSIITTWTRGGMIDIDSSLTVQEFVDAYKGKENSCNNDEEYVINFKNIIKNIQVHFNPATMGEEVASA